MRVSSENYSCVYDGCFRKFVSVPTLKKHALLCNQKNKGDENDSKIDNLLRSELSSSIQCSSVGIKNDSNAVNICQSKLSTEIPCSSKDDSFILTELDSDITIDENFLENKLITFIGKLYSNKTITKIVVNDIISEFIDFLDGFGKTISESLQKVIPAEYHNQIKNVCYVNILSNFDSEYKRQKFFERANGLIQPMQFIIGEIDDDKKVDGSTVKTKKQCFGYLVPMRETLKQFLELPNTFQTVINYMRTEMTHCFDNKLYSSLFQGKSWIDISANFDGKIVIPLYLYYDDFS